MERLQIENFLVIKKADFEIRDINIIIGPQANGKSIISKLVYFFNDFLRTTFLTSVENFETKRQLEKKAIKDFESYFPKYSWAEQKFSIKFSTENFSLSIVKDSDLKNTAAKFDYSADLISLHKKLKNAFKKQLSSIKEKKEDVDGWNRSDNGFWEMIQECVYQKEFGKDFHGSIFVPASRSFFANLQKNVFSFLASNINIDPFIKEFGSKYETAKNFHDNDFRVNDDDEKSIEFSTKVNNLTELILRGAYHYEEEQDWIKYKGKKTNLANASSGQQESLPMLLVLKVWASVARKSTFFIEEPEAHLFPVSQKHIMTLVALINNIKKHNFIITTHSPYILTALNNMIFASTISSSKKEKLSKIIDVDSVINIDKLSAYTIDDGVLENIVDRETGLVGESIIDSVSDEFDSTLNELLILDMES